MSQYAKLHVDGGMTRATTAMLLLNASDSMGLASMK